MALFIAMLESLAAISKGAVMACVALLLGVEEVPQELIDALHRAIRRKTHTRHVHDVRIASHHSTTRDFESEAAYEAVFDPRSRGVDGMDERVLDQQKNCLAHAFGHYTIQDVVVVVYGPRPSDDAQPGSWEWVVALVAADAPVYQVHQSESNPDEFYMTGRGFGDVINATKPQNV